MSKCILLVDDEVEIVNFLENFLRRLKINSITATSGEEALTLYNPDAIDYVFLDIQLKGMDGISVLEELKKRNPEVKVIMITGKAEKDCQDRAKNLGVIDYITKPLDLGELKEKIDRYIVH